MEVQQIPESKYSGYKWIDEFGSLSKKNDWNSSRKDTVSFWTCGENWPFNESNCSPLNEIEEFYGTTLDGIWFHNYKGYEEEVSKKCVYSTLGVLEDCFRKKKQEGNFERHWDLG